MASGRISARLIVDGAVSFAFIPVFEAVAFALVLRTGARRRVPFARAADLFFTGNAPWLLWIVVVTALAGVVPPRNIGPWLFPIVSVSLAVAAWAAALDYRFFREVSRRPARGALQDVLVYRAIAWGAIVPYFLGIAAWPEIAGRLGW